MRGRCPRCGQGELFQGYLAPQPKCSVCGLDFAFADSGDGPAFFVMSITGFAAVVLAVILMALFELPMGAVLLLAFVFTMALTFALLRPAKGLLIGLQYKNGAEEGRLQ